MVDRSALLADMDKARRVKCAKYMAIMQHMMQLLRGRRERVKTVCALQLCAGG